MKLNRILLALIAGGVASTAALAQDNWQDYLDQVHIKKAIADQLSPQELEQRRERLARWLAEKAANPTPQAPGDSCGAATFEIGPLPFNGAGSTIGQADDYQLPSTVAAPTCTAASACVGAGPPASLPRGAIYTGTGVGADQAFRIRTSANCTLGITMTPSFADLALIVYEGQCSNNLSDCNCVDDTGVAGGFETVSLTAAGGSDYFVVTDGYSAGGTPPGPQDSYTLSITGSGCSLVPVELQSFEIL
jgi:hypothetical protein